MCSLNLMHYCLDSRGHFSVSPRALSQNPDIERYCCRFRIEAQREYSLPGQALFAISFSHPMPLLTASSSVAVYRQYVRQPLCGVNLYPQWACCNSPVWSRSTRKDPAKIKVIYRVSNFFLVSLPEFEFDQRIAWQRIIFSRYY